ncbi:MAG TPA: V-type ATP synthase subunit F [Candidatus Acidoferrales bacterium]|nr:V-type ATP synthase subunit F [Candidatus Acidoferrales bacterium]
MSDIAVIGDRDTVIAFQLGGIDGYVVDDAESARRAVAQACDVARRTEDATARTKLLLVTHHVVSLIREGFDADELESSMPMVLEIPGFAEPGGQRPLQKLLARVLRTER